ncbi:DUF3035 domain-containing protein [Yoonia litorea]|uniref:Lipoprotein-attachment site-containing protein n=1 Tax=Yoonia litorea TaxID=1123755 RepID=A0A1I6MX93_9RHOB|nr:Protein of unknown function [Yoonia litorea]
MRRRVLSVLALILMAACGGPGPDFANPLAIEGGGPDATDLRLNDPLVIPPTNTLPQPTPGGANLADPG